MRKAARGLIYFAFFFAFFVLGFRSPLVAALPGDDEGPRAHASLGWLSQLEKDAAYDEAMTTGPALALGINLRGWTGLLEYSSLKALTQTSGVLRSDRQFESLLFWGTYQPKHFFWLKPYFGLGLGGSRHIVTTQLYEQSQTDTGLWSPSWGVLAGAKWLPTSNLALALEMRGLRNVYFDPELGWGVMFSVTLFTR